MLAAVDGEHLAGDAAGAGQIGNRVRDLRRGRAAAERHRRALARKRRAVLAGLASVGPGPTALTRMRGASACASVLVAANRADLVSV